MEKIKIRTRIDWWIALVLFAVGAVLPMVFVLGICLDWFANSDTVIIAITAGSLFAFIAIIVVLNFYSTYYMLDEKGLTVRNIFFHTKTVSYDDILHVEKSINIINRPKTWAAPFSVIGIQIDYKKNDKESSWFFIAPRNRQEFMEYLQNKISKKSD